MKNQEQNLKRVLDTKDVIAMTVGLIIGAGVMTLTGLAITRTGTGVSLAYLLSAVLTVIISLPVAQLSSAAPSAGASYKYSSRLIGSKWGFFYLMTYIPSFVCFSVYALGFAEYFGILFPAVDPYITAMGVLTLFFIINLLGTRNLSIVQNVIVILLLVTLVLFIGFGMSKVDYAALVKPENLFPDGAMGMVTAAALLSFAMAGGTFMAGMGSEMKNPGRDIPLGIIAGTLGVGLIYALIGIVASGVLPWQSVSDASLAAVAEQIFPKALFYIFIIGGGLGATASTINATYSYVTKPLISACQDGWLPGKMGKVNAKTGIPVALLTLFWIIGMVPLIFRIPMATVADLCCSTALLGCSIVPIALIRMMKKRPDLYEKSIFKLPKKWILPISIVSIILAVFQAYALLSTFSGVLQIVVLIYLAVIILLGFLLEKKVPIADDLTSEM
jgi:APA family basic amino acid/polyamine antiporter